LKNPENHERMLFTLVRRYRLKILVDLFNFWVDQGNAPEDEEESTNRIKVGKIIITVTLQF
jgi:hypothetical protein